MKMSSLVGAVCAAVLCLAGPADALCVGEEPTVVLKCYTAAYANRDVEALRKLLSDDFMWVSVAPPEVDVWGSPKAIKAASAMFGDPRLESLELVFEGEFKVVPETEPDTWRIEGIEASLVTDMVEIEPYTARACVTLYVRRAVKGTGENQQQGDFQIYREVTFGNSDCAAWGAAGGD